MIDSATWLTYVVVVLGLFLMRGPAMLRTLVRAAAEGRRVATGRDDGGAVATGGEDAVAAGLDARTQPRPGHVRAPTAIPA